MKSFIEWLEDKMLVELAPDSQTSTRIVGATFNAQDINSPANVAKNLAANNRPLAGAVAIDPTTQAIKAKLDALKKQNQPQQQQQTSQQDIAAAAAASSPR